MLRILIYKLLIILFVFISILELKANENIYYQNPNKIIELFKSGSVTEIYNQFDTTMQKKLTPRRLEPIWSQMQRNYGDFVEVEIKDTTSKLNSTIVNTNILFERGIMNMMLSWDLNSKKIDDFYLTEIKKEAFQSKEINLPAYIDTNTFTRKDIIIESNYLLEGELTIPKSNTKSTNTTFILVSGSGRQSKDVKVGPNRVFKNLAWGLSSFGFAVLRYDKITYKHSQKLIREKPDYIYSDEYIEPIKSALNKVKSISEIKNNKLILIGYDEGAKAVSELITNEDVDGLILIMAAPTKQYNLDLDKLKYLFTFDNMITPTEKSMISSAESKVKYYKTLKTDSNLNKDSLPLRKSYKYLQSLEKINPLSRLKQTNKPVLIINGNNDFEIREKHFAEWNILSQKQNIVLLQLDEINHLMSNSEKKSHPKEYRKEAPISPIIFNKINQWIKQNE